jgi:hypothetical protein
MMVIGRVAGARDCFEPLHYCTQTSVGKETTRGCGLCNRTGVLSKQHFARTTGATWLHVVFSSSWTGSLGW